MRYVRLIFGKLAVDLKNMLEYFHEKEFASPIRLFLNSLVSMKVQKSEFNQQNKAPDACIFLPDVFWICIANEIPK